MECELLESARRLAKKRGLDHRTVYCPPDKMAICTGTGCSLLSSEVEVEVDSTPPSPMERFYNRLERHVSLVQL